MSGYVRRRAIVRNGSSTPMSGTSSHSQSLEVYASIVSDDGHSTRFYNSLRRDGGSFLT